MKLSFVAAVALAAAPAFAAPITLEADPAHSTAGFTVKHMGFTNVRGVFSKMQSTLHWDAQDPTKSSVETRIDAASVDTHNESRDKHLKSADFFDVQKCPEITFKSTSVEKSGDGYKVAGDLTMHCVTKPVTLTVETDGKPHKTPFGTEVYTFSATGKLNRKDWGLNWNKALEAGGVLVSDDVTLNLDLEYGQKPAAQAKETKAETKASKKK